jgi:hypothetical protein
MNAFPLTLSLFPEGLCRNGGQGTEGQLLALCPLANSQTAQGRVVISCVLFIATQSPRERGG